MRKASDKMSVVKKRDDLDDMRRRIPRRERQQYRDSVYIDEKKIDALIAITYSTYTYK